MLESLMQTAQSNLPTLAAAAVGVGALIAVMGVASMLKPDPALRRMARQVPRREVIADAGLLRPGNDRTPSGMMKALVPTDKAERMQVQRQLALAGLTGEHAMRNYYLTRIVLGFLLPAAVMGAIWASRAGYLPLPARIEIAVGGLSQLMLTQIMAGMVAVGFFGPAYWLKARAGGRHRAIEDAFPNALDLIQISVEAGMGFDAAMIRVGNELASTAPELSEEFLAAQREIQAGRSRDRALLDMAARTGVDEVSSFANVVLQAMQFGTSMSDALTVYAREMRLSRELRAQEAANRLPVKMSIALASLLLPALLLLTLGPVVIRYVRYFSS
ncbi:type II secretion system F family protein [Cereibacter sphaeroides]|uniref:type II secretion system F family protein n=1 Tax=Cereibacter sphaeroides TaxID=1063 RepID=UPI001F1F8786|nr:type II secretion system F family protein [Cereibacter sphaeroides]MCE6951407.1 type II secretion system F family protein [Cereibacter sphaeroides]